MSLSFIFAYAPIPLTQKSPIAHAAAIDLRRLAEARIITVHRHRFAAPTKTEKVG